MKLVKSGKSRAAAPEVCPNPEIHRANFVWATPVPPSRLQPGSNEAPLQLRSSILPAFPDLVDKALQPYPEALDAVARAVKEWYEREDAASRL